MNSPLKPSSPNAVSQVLIPIPGLFLWLAACYWLRFALMENPAWIGICETEATALACGVRAKVGLVIHWQLLPLLALGLAVPGFFLTGRNGRWLAWAALLFAAPALALYTVTLAVFALLLAGLRLVRSERQSANTNKPQTSAQASA